MRKRTGRRRGAVALAFLAVSATSAFAATWWRLPVWGAEVRVFAIDPFERGRVYCGTSRGNFYGSTDGGVTWTPLRSGPAFPGYIVTGLVADAGKPERLWASLAGEYTGGLVVRSDNRGQDWAILGQWKHAVATRALALSQGAEPHIAVGGDDGVFLSSDGGATWKRVGAEMAGLSSVESLAFDPADVRTLYAGTWRQAFRTRDGGATWSRIADGMVLDATVYSWDINPEDSRDIWVSTCGWVYRSRDGGDHWARSKNGFTNRRSHSVRRDPDRQGVVYAATVGGLHVSADGGETWTRASRESLVVTALAVDKRSGRLFVGTEGEGVFYSDDGAATLRSGSAGLAEGRVSDLVPDPNDPSRVFFFRSYGGDESGVWEAEGMQVKRVSRDPLPAAASLAAFRDRDGRTALILSSSAGVRVSRDAGVHWSVPESPPAGVPLGLFGAPFAPPVLVTSSGVFRTGQDGQTFSPVLGGPTAPLSAELLADGAGGPLLEVRTSDGVLRWNGGEWSPIRRALLKGGMFLQGAPGGAAVSYSTLQDVDGTLVWEEGSRRLALTSPRPGLALASAAEAKGGLVYIGTTGDGLFLFQP